MPELRRLVFVLALTSLAAVALATALFLFLRRPLPKRPEPPPEPRLQAAPREDLAELRRREASLLNSYGWSDRGRGWVRVPIERAMELLLKEDKNK